MLPCPVPRCKKYFSGKMKLRQHYAEVHPGVPFPEDLGTMVPDAPAPAPPAPAAASSASGSPAPGPEGPAPVAAAEKKGKEKLSFTKRITARLKAGHENTAQPVEEWELPEKKVEQAVLGFINLLKDGIRFVDRIVGYPPIADSVFELEPAERMNLGILLQAPTTKFFKFLGYKTLEEASMAIDGFNIFSAFAFMGLGIFEHFWGLGKEIGRRRDAGLTLTGKELSDEQKKDRIERKKGGGWKSRLDRLKKRKQTEPADAERDDGGGGATGGAADIRGAPGAVPA